MDAALACNTSVAHFMDMPVGRFLDIWQAACAVHKRRAEQTGRGSGGAPKPRRHKRKGR